MEAYVLDWLQLIFRWLHVITGVAWIGASFYFVWLDNHLEAPPPWKAEKGIRGELWAIHGGGIYEVSKYKLAPEKLPETLHWFKWEAYSTWLSGMTLMILIFYVGAETYLIDPRVSDLSQWQAIGVGLSFLVGGWILYEVLCSTRLARKGYALGAVLFLAAAVLSYALTHLFSGRGAFIHMGAVIGTVMAANVYRVIIPSQRALVAAMESMQQPSPAWGIKAKLRSTHNNYLSLPLLFIMISNHYPMTYTGEHSWLVLVAIIAITAFARHYFNLRHRGIHSPIILLVSLAAVGVLAWVLVPDKAANSTSLARSASVDARLVQNIVKSRCATCHSAAPTDDVFTVAPSGVLLDSIADMQQWAARIKVRVVDSPDMPFQNKTGMTEQERQLLGQWIRAGAPGE